MISGAPKAATRAANQPSPRDENERARQEGVEGAVVATRGILTLSGPIGDHASADRGSIGAAVGAERAATGSTPEEHAKEFNRYLQALRVVPVGPPCSAEFNETDKWSDISRGGSTARKGSDAAQVPQI
jgi:hypothetical protein